MTTITNLFWKIVQFPFFAAAWIYVKITDRTSSRRSP
jgi:hypothetical protein